MLGWESKMDPSLCVLRAGIGSCVCVLCETVGQGPARVRHYLVPGRPRLVVRLATMVGSGNALTDCQLLWLVVEVVRSSCTAGTLVPGYHGTMVHTLVLTPLSIKIVVPDEKVTQKSVHNPCFEPNEQPFGGHK